MFGKKDETEERYGLVVELGKINYEHQNQIVQAIKLLKGVVDVEYRALTLKTFSCLSVKEHHE